MKSIFKTSLGTVMLLSTATGSAMAMEPSVSNLPGQELTPYVEGATVPKTIVAKQNANSQQRIKTSDIPVGETKAYETKWMCLYGNSIIDNTGVASVIRFDEDNNVYFHDLFAQGEDYWVSGTIDESGLIKIPMQQYTYDHDVFGPLTLELTRFTYNEDGTMGSEVISSPDYYTLQLNADGTITSTDLAKDWFDRYYVIITSQYGGTFGLIGSIQMVPITDTVVTPPADCVLNTYSYSCFVAGEQKASFVEVGIDDNDVYVSGLCTALPDVWLKGTFNEDKTQLIFESGQYMGVGEYVHYFSAKTLYAQEIDGEMKYTWETDPALVCNVSEDGKSFYFNDQNYFTVTIADDVAYYCYTGRLEPYELKAVTPANPIELDLIDIGDCWVFNFVQPLVDVDGGVLDPEYLTWRMYIDDKLYTFDPFDYESLSEPATELPYLLNDGWDFWQWGTNDQCVALYDPVVYCIGVESVYTVNGEKQVSERVFYGESAVEKVETSESPVSTEFYDIYGRAVVNPSTGLYIRVERYADGTSKSIKTRVR